MFTVWTIGTIWIILVFDNAWLERPIRDHSIQSLQVLAPSTPFEWALVFSWIFPFLFLISSSLSTRRLMQVYKDSLIPPIVPSIFGSTGRFDWFLIGLGAAAALTGWATQFTQLLLPASIITIGLSFSQLEH